MVAKHIYDVRGKQSLIFRLWCSDREALLHAATYRAAMIVAAFAVVAMVVGIYSYGNPLTSVSEKLIFCVGLLMTPQIFESFKAMIVIITKGVVFGKLNPSFLKFGVKRSAIYPLYSLVPYIVTVVWLIGLVWLGILWAV
jgi:hypothetical protein